MTDPSRTSRRVFLRLLTAGATAPVAAKAMGVERVLASTLLRHGRDSGRPGFFQELRRDYLLGDDLIYLNHGSIGTVPRPVLEALKGYLELCELNPWLYMWGGAWEEPREDVRQKASRLLGCSPSEMAITHNTTEGFNVLAHGLPMDAGDEVLFSSLNHPGASVAWFHMAEVRGFTVRTFDFPLTDASSLTTSDVIEIYRREIRPNTRTLVFPHVDNIFGIRHPLREMTAMARREGVEFVAADGAQSAGMIPVALAESGIDVFAASPHKWIQSPKGLGLLFVREELRETLRPMSVTWGQERWAGSVRIFEDYGTRNLPETLALGDALDYQAALGEENKQVRYRAIWQQLRDRVDASPGLRWRSPTTWEEGASLVAVEARGRPVVELAQELYRQSGVVLRAFEAPDLNTMRLSPNVATSDEEIERFFAVVEAAL